MNPDPEEESIPSPIVAFNSGPVHCDPHNVLEQWMTDSDSGEESISFQMVRFKPDLILYDPHGDLEQWTTDSESGEESIPSPTVAFNSDPVLYDPHDDLEQWTADSESGEESIPSSMVSFYPDLVLYDPHDGLEPWTADSDSAEDSVLSPSELEIERLRDPGRRVPLTNGLNSEDMILYPRGHPKRWMSLTRVDYRYESHCKQAKTTKDLERAIAVAREALQLCPHGHRDRSKFFNSLAVALATRFDQLGNIADLDEAISLEQAALDLRPRGHLDRPKSLNNIALDLCFRYKKLGKMEDLDMAISLAIQALDLCPRGHRDRPTFLSNLAVGLSTRYEGIGDINDLNQAITHGRDALNLRPRGHPDRLVFLNKVIQHILLRHERPWNTHHRDLDDLIILTHEAAELLPQGHADRPHFLLVVAHHLATRYELCNKTTDLNGAIVLEEEALDLCPQENPLRSSTLNDLAFHLSTRYDRLRRMADLNRVIVLAREILDHHPAGNPDRPSALNNLAVHLFIRYNCFETITDLDEAIIIGKEAFRLRLSSHPDWSKALEDLACYLCARFEDSHHLQDEEDLFNLYAELTDHLQMATRSDVCAAKAWANAAERFNHPTILLAHKTCIRLSVYHLATLFLLPDNPPMLRRLTASDVMDAFAVYLRAHQLEMAVEILEQGRCVFWNQIARICFPQDDVAAAADELAQLVLHFYNATKSPGSTDYIAHLNVEFQRVVANIRNVPGLHDFLLPPVFAELQRAADCGPVIIVNTSQYSCDALIIFEDRHPVHIQMQITKARVQEVAAELRPSISHDELVDILRELWDMIVFPIVNILQEVLPARSRIWWCPTAELSLLPLHASGPYQRGEQNLSDIYISSYTPSLTALIHARRQPPNFEGKRKRFLTISPFSEFPPFTSTVPGKLDPIGRRVQDLAVLTRLEGPDSCISRVREELKKNEWVHLACHNRLWWRFPLKTACILDDGDFTIQQIMNCDVAKKAEFAFLGTSQTSIGDRVLNSDETIHLTSAMLFAGFRSIVGAMCWGEADDVPPRVVSKFYENMMDGSSNLDYTRAAFALNQTMNSLTDSDIPLRQRILYVHIGA